MCAVSNNFERHLQLEQFELLSKAVCTEFKHGEYGFVTCLDIWKRHLFEANSITEFYTSLYRVEPPLTSQKFFLEIIKGKCSLPDMQKVYLDLIKNLRPIAIDKAKKCCSKKEFSCWEKYLLNF